LVNLAEARACGLSPDQVRYRVLIGRWEKILPGVFRIAGAPLSWHQSLTAAVLWAGRHAAISHRAAAALWGLEGCAPGVVELSTDRDRKAIVPWIALHRVARLDAADLTNLGPIAVTTPTRTLVDLCAVLEPESLEGALDDALRRGLASLPRLRWAAKRLEGRGCAGTRVLRGALQARDRAYLPHASRLEARLFSLLARGGLPSPVRQLEVRERGTLLARVDFAYPDALLAIEADGYRYHSGRVAWQHDLVRRNALTSRGWRVLHVTWEDLRMRPADVLGEIRRALGGADKASGRSRRRRLG
jgi:very-short-patch-repair endonuclease